MELTAREFRHIFVTLYRRRKLKKQVVQNLLNQTPACQMKLVPLTVRRIVIKLSGVGNE